MSARISSSSSCSSVACKVLDTVLCCIPCRLLQAIALIPPSTQHFQCQAVHELGPAHLEAEALAAPGRHQHQAVIALQQTLALSTLAAS